MLLNKPNDYYKINEHTEVTFLAGLLEKNVHHHQDSQ